MGMMVIDSARLSAIAEAIRQAGGTGTFTPPEMPGAILGLGTARYRAEAAEAGFQRGSATAAFAVGAHGAEAHVVDGS